GLLAAAILVVNNVRDIDTDRRAGKRTLAVKIGRPAARRLYDAMIAIAFLAPVVVWLAGGLSFCLLLALLSEPLAATLVQAVSTRKDCPWLYAAVVEN